MHALSKVVAAMILLIGSGCSSENSPSKARSVTPILTDLQLEGPVSDPVLRDNIIRTMQIASRVEYGEPYLATKGMLESSGMVVTDVTWGNSNATGFMSTVPIGSHKVISAHGGDVDPTFGNVVSLTLAFEMDSSGEDGKLVRSWIDFNLRAWEATWFEE